MTRPKARPFRRSECVEAGARWSGITGLGHDSPEWGEVYQVLHDSGFLAAAEPDPALFEVDPGDAQQDAVLRLRLCIVVGAQVAEAWEHKASHGVATATAVVAALLGVYYQGGLWTVSESLVDLLTSDIPGRVLDIVDHPSDALARLDVEVWPQDVSAPKRLMALSEAMWRVASSSDEFARAVFADLAARPGHWPRIVSLCTGQWVLYDPTPAGERQPAGT